MPFVPDGRGGFCKIKNKNYEEAFVLLLKAAPYGAASGQGHNLSDEDKARDGERALVVAEGETVFFNNNTRKLSKVRLCSSGETIEWPYNWWQVDENQSADGVAPPVAEAPPAAKKPPAVEQATKVDVKEEAVVEAAVEEAVVEEAAVEEVAGKGGMDGKGGKGGAPPKRGGREFSAQEIEAQKKFAKEQAAAYAARLEEIGEHTGVGDVELASMEEPEHLAQERASAACEVLCANDDDYHRLMEGVFMDKWLSVLEEYTFKSDMIPMKTEWLEAVYAVHKTYWDEENQKPHGVPIEEVMAAQSPEAQEAFAELAQACDDARARLGIESIFIRFDTRSLKDVPVFEPEYGPNVMKEHNRLQEAESDAQDDREHQIDRRLRAIHRVLINMLASNDGMKSVKMMCKSHRIPGDFAQEIKVRQTNPTHDFNLCVREFVGFPVDYELRAFVYKGKFTCLSQYNNFVLSPGINKHAEGMAAECKTFLEGKVIPGLAEIGLDSYVLDLALDPQEDGSHTIYVVELNPMAEFAGGAMFKWSLDKPVMLGYEPFEFRYNTDVPKFQGVNPDQEKFMHDVINYVPKE